MRWEYWKEGWEREDGKRRRKMRRGKDWKRRGRYRWEEIGWEGRERRREDGKIGRRKGYWKGRRRKEMRRRKKRRI